MIEYDYTLGLALEDYVTVILFGIGLYFLGRMALDMDRSAGRIVFAGGLLITLGGILQASWKLTVATKGTDIRWMNDSQFIWMAPGFIILAAGFSQALKVYRNQESKLNEFVTPAAAIMLTFALSAYLNANVEGRAWFFALLGVTTVANVIVSAALVGFSWQQTQKLASFLFLMNILLVFTVAGMAGVLGQDLIGQWIKQITNNISFGAFAFASYLIARHVSSQSAAIS